MVFGFVSVACGFARWRGSRIPWTARGFSMFAFCVGRTTCAGMRRWRRGSFASLTMITTEKELRGALDVLQRAGVVVVVPGARVFSLASVAAQLDVSVGWVRDHLSEFEGWFRLPGGGRNGGEIRILEKDVAGFLSRRATQSKGVTV